MKNIILLILTFFLSLPVSSLINLEIKDNEGFAIYTSSRDAPVLFDKSDTLVFGKVASLFSDDVGRVTGHKRSIINFGKEKLHLSHAIIVGTLKGSLAIRDIVRKGRIDTTGLSKGWEGYRI